MKTKQSYTTAGLPEANRLEAWRQYMSEVYYRLDIVPRDGEWVRGELDEAELDAIGVSHFSADAQRVVRYKEAAQIDGSENFVFLFPTREPLVFEQRGRTGRVDPGGVVMLSSAEDYAVTVPDGSENITLKISCDVMRPRLRRIDGRVARDGIANPHLVPVVSQMGQQLLQLQTAQQSLRLQDAVLELVCLMLELEDGASNLELVHKPLAELTFNRLRDFMQQHLRDPELSPAQVARAHRVSLRYLHKVFQLQGTTFGHELMEARLQEAHRLLRNAAAGAGARPQIGQVAFACGFTSQAHFSVRYRERFGMAPRETVC